MMPKQMLSVKALGKSLRQSFQQMNRHFTDGKQEIAHNNSMSLMSVSTCGIILEIVLLAITPILIPHWEITIWHWLMLPFFVLFDGVGYLLLRKGASYRATHLCVLLFTFILLLLVLCLDLVPYPTSSATIIAVAMSVVPVLFILPFHETVFMLLTVLVCFLIVNGQQIDPSLASRNVFHGVLGCVCGVMVSWVVTNIRAEDNKGRQLILHESQFDALTGIPNKMTVERACTTYLQRENACCGLIVLDMDTFKAVNDKYGHHTGDSVLSTMGSSIRAVFRESDVYGRIGGDEFLILMKDTADAAVISRKMKQMTDLIHSEVQAQIGISVTCSYGAIIMAADQHIPYLSLFNMADKILYHAKKTGKNRGEVMTVADFDCMMAARKIMLIADDGEVNREILKNIFENDYDVIEAASGLEAIEVIQKHHGILGVMLLDIMMPEMSGFDVLQWIHAQKGIEPFPVIAISADSSTELQSLEMGVADMITKPFNPDVVRMRVERVMHGR